MFKPTLLQKIFHFLEIKTRKYRAKILNKKLNNKDFTIISNNCWGGIVYEAYNLIKQSPTVGTYLFAEDYLKLIQNLKYYMSLELEIISVDEAKHKKEIIKNGNLNCPIGRLDDIEIIFVHYKTKELAYKKWMKRTKKNG